MSDAVSAPLPLPEATAGQTDVLRYLELATPAARLGFWQLDLDTEALWWSPEIYRIHGVEPGRYTPDIHSAIAFYHPDDVDEVRAMLDRVVQGSRYESFDLRIRRGTGETRFVRSAATCREDSADGRARILGTFLDVTYETLTGLVREGLGRLNFAERLDERERIEQLLAIVRDIADAEIATICHEMGASEDAPDFVAGPVADIPKLSCFLAEPIGVDGRKTATLRLYAAMDSRVIGDVQYTLLHLLAGMIRYEIVLLAHTRELEEARAALLAREQELEMIFENVPVRIWYKDERNRILRLNRAAARCMGVTPLDVERDPTLPRYPNAGATYQNDDVDALESRRARSGIIERYTTSYIQTGWARTDKLPFRDTRTGERRLLVVSQDVSDIMRTQEKLERQARELRSANQSLDEFAYIASHDLRSPMRAISQIASWLAEDNEANLGDESKATLALLIRRVNRMERMLQDILAYSRSGRKLPDAEAVDCNVLVAEILGEINPPPGFDVVVEEELPTLRVPRVALKQVLSNLISNAIKHHDLEAGTVTVAAGIDGDATFLRVTDDGPGIEPRYHTRIFRMFETLAPRDAVEGTGIGLAIVRRLAGALRGDVSVSSAGGRGTTFTLRLPASVVVA